MKVYQFLKMVGAIGQVHKVRMSDITKYFDSNERVIKQAVHNERMAGLPILSSMAGGYYIAADIAEIDRCIATNRSRQKKINETTEALLKIRRLYEQESTKTEPYKQMSLFDYQ